MRIIGGIVISFEFFVFEVGVQMLCEGGYAVDVAIVVGFVFVVIWFEVGNIGGGGFMFIWSHDG